MTKTEWIAVDWGTSNLRIWGMRANGEVLGELSSDQGMSTLKKDEFEPVLLSHIEPWLGDGAMPVVACGMVGSRQGWAEAPYAQTPIAPAIKSVKIDSKSPRIDVHIIAGIKQSDPADVMRGEETQIAGYLAKNPDFQGVLVLPGTHSKWVSIKAGQVQSFKTVLTGEMYALLSKQSVLRHSMGEWDFDAYSKAVRNFAESSLDLTARLFEIRAEHLLNDEPNGAARLSGTLIGSEIKGMQHLWQDQDTSIIGSGELVALYEQAFEIFHKKTEHICADNLTLMGLTKVYNEIYK